MVPKMQAEIKSVFLQMCSKICHHFLLSVKSLAAECGDCN